MRLVAFLLLLGNAGFFIWHYYHPTDISPHFTQNSLPVTGENRLVLLEEIPGVKDDFTEEYASEESGSTDHIAGNGEGDGKTAGKADSLVAFAGDTAATENPQNTQAQPDTNDATGTGKEADESAQEKNASGEIVALSAEDLNEEPRQTDATLLASSGGETKLAEENSMDKPVLAANSEPDKVVSEFADGEVEAGVEQTVAVGSGTVSLTQDGQALVVALDGHSLAAMQSAEIREKEVKATVQSAGDSDETGATPISVQDKVTSEPKEIEADRGNTINAGAESSTADSQPVISGEIEAAKLPSSSPVGEAVPVVEAVTLKQMAMANKLSGLGVNSAPPAFDKDVPKQGKTKPPAAAKVLRTLSSVDIPKTKGNLSCYRSGPFKTQEKARQSLAWLREHGIQAGLYRERSLIPAATRVYLPSYPSRQAARVVQQMLLRQNVDNFLMTKAGFVNAISLGIYQDKNSVQRRVAELRAKGYHNVSTQVSYAETSLYWVDIQLPPQQQPLLPTLLKIMEPGNIPCEEIAMHTEIP